ncbi:LacI family DNA-binding transcriptional regulator [Streptacidiphilus monticola]
MDSTPVRTTLRPTLAEVARHAGVSTATASRVLNRSAPVSERVAAAVEAAAAELGYVRHRAPAGAPGRPARWPSSCSTASRS